MSQLRLASAPAVALPASHDVGNGHCVEKINPSCARQAALMARRSVWKAGTSLRLNSVDNRAEQLSSERETL